jgi:hypothetical protein
MRARPKERRASIVSKTPPLADQRRGGSTSGGIAGENRKLKERNPDPVRGIRSSGEGYPAMRSEALYLKEDALAQER